MTNINKKVCIVLALLVNLVANAQRIEVVSSKTLTTYDGKSYLYKNEVRFLPTPEGFIISAASVGEFFCRHDNIVNQPASPDRNFVRSETILKRGVVEERHVSALSSDKKRTVYEYTDGLGRNSQTITVEGSPSNSDIIQFSAFDNFGRTPNEYLPYTVSEGLGAYRKDASSAQVKYYSNTSTSHPFGVATDSEPFRVNIFDNSPLNVIRQSYDAGSDWHESGANKPVKKSIRVNGSNEVRQWTYAGSGTPQVSSYFSPNVVMVTETVDEENHIQRTYKNFKDQVILERNGDGATWYDTYYVYNHSGKVIYVFPPEATNRIFQTNSEYQGKTTEQQQAFIDTWAFQYKYDEYTRLTDKRVPGAGWVYMIYDSWDRLVLTQDAVQRLTNQWTFTKYDIFNRPVITGFASGARATLQNSAKNSLVRFETPANNTTGYTNSTFPSHNDSDLLTLTYYDNYSFLTNTGWDAEGISFSFVGETGYELNYFGSLKGYTTGSKTRQAGTSKWLNAVTYYNSQYNVIQIISENHLGGYDRTSTLCDFDGTKLTTKQTHNSPLGSVVVTEEYGYDHAKRLQRIWHQIGGGPKILMLYHSYNELGQVIEKNIHSTNEGAAFLQSVDMRYNIRGWITNINNGSLTNDGALNNDVGDLFGMEMLYNNPPLGISDGTGGVFNTRKMYDGNISAIKWKMDTKESGVTVPEKIYGFNYDQFGRFRNSYYATRNGTAWTSTPGFYNETVNRYDANGNIGGEVGGVNTGALSRTGMSNGTKTTLDNLTYRYSGNQLKNVVDAGNSMGFSDKPGVPLTMDEFKYDENGNLKEDFNKSISLITYNHLNLPAKIELTQPGGKIDRIEFGYDAQGNKLFRTVSVNGTSGSPGTLVWRTDYVGGIQYDNNKISFINTTEGRATYNGSGYDYEYFYKDHQGNVRLCYGALKETLSYKATMEIALAATEQDAVKGFKNVAERRINPGEVSLNFTRPSEKVLIPDRSAKCNANAGQSVGPAKSLRVLAGDAVYMEVYARYTQQLLNGHQIITAAVLGAAVNLAFGISKTGEPTLYNGINSNAAVASGGVTFSTQPKAYLVYLFFDDNSIFQRSAAVGISVYASNAFEKLSRSFTADKNGHLYIYVASESDLTAASVYFDDFYIVHQKNNSTLQVTQASDYYPFGLSFNEYHADRLKTVSTSPDIVYEPMLQNRYRFQGQELQKDLNLGWYQYKYRMHDPAVGRFGGVDPLAEEFMYNSTYAFSENKLIDAVELEGTEMSKAIYETMKYVSPISFKFNIHGGTHRAGIGYEVSIGIPKAFPFSVRKNYGTTFYFHDAIQKNAVTENRVATETSYFGLISMQSTKYRSGETSQTTGMVTLGNPLVNVQYENDWFSDGIASFLDPLGFHPRNFGDAGDRYRTAGLRLNVGLLNTGFNLATGDPGLSPRKEFGEGLGPNGTYFRNLLGNDPDKYRLGIGYFGVGNYRLGLDSEHIRNLIQNDFAHDWLTGSPRFYMMPRSNELFLEYSTGTGTQW